MAPAVETGQRLYNLYPSFRTWRKLQGVSRWGEDETLAASSPAVYLATIIVPSQDLWDTETASLKFSGYPPKQGQSCHRFANITPRFENIACLLLIFFPLLGIAFFPITSCIALGIPYVQCNNCIFSLSLFGLPFFSTVYCVEIFSLIEIRVSLYFDILSFEAKLFTTFVSRTRYHVSFIRASSSFTARSALQRITIYICIYFFSHAPLEFHTAKNGDGHGNGPSMVSGSFAIAVVSYRYDPIQTLVTGT